MTITSGLASRKPCRAGRNRWPRRRACRSVFRPTSRCATRRHPRCSAQSSTGCWRRKRGLGRGALSDRPPRGLGRADHPPADAGPAPADDDPCRKRTPCFAQGSALHGRQLPGRIARHISVLRRRFRGRIAQNRITPRCSSLTCFSCSGGSRRVNDADGMPIRDEEIPASVHSISAPTVATSLRPDNDDALLTRFDDLDLGHLRAEAQALMRRYRDRQSGSAPALWKKWCPRRESNSHTRQGGGF